MRVPQWRGQIPRHGMPEKLFQAVPHEPKVKEDYDGPAWVRPSARPQMKAILHHPRLVFDEIGSAEEEMIEYYVKIGRPFTVVVGSGHDPG